MVVALVVVFVVVVVDVLTIFRALCSVFDRYSKYSKVDVSKAIDLEMKGDIESCLTAVGGKTDYYRVSHMLQQFMYSVNACMNISYIISYHCY